MQDRRTLKAAKYPDMALTAALYKAKKEERGGGIVSQLRCPLHRWSLVGREQCGQYVLVPKAIKSALALEAPLCRCYCTSLVSL